MSELGPKADVPMRILFSGRRGYILEEGFFVGKFQLHDVIGAGTFSTVYRADDQNSDTYAVKVSHADFENLYKREGQMHAAITGKPHVVPLVEYGRGESQYGTRNYIVTRFGAGGDLKEYLKLGALPLNEVVLFTNQLSEGLTNIHQQQILHRDIKPGNAYFTSSNKDNLEIGDFGSALLLPQADNFRDQHFTTAYAAPEEINRGEVSIATDVFSLALITAEMLHGKRLFKGNEKKFSRLHLDTTRYDKYVRKKVNTLQIRGRGAFVQPIKKALERDPDKRYQSAADFAGVIEERGLEILTARPDRGRTYFIARRRVNEIVNKMKAQ
jgi:serine/threonine protein kinase